MASLLDLPVRVSSSNNNKSVNYYVLNSAHPLWWFRSVQSVAPLLFHARTARTNVCTDDASLIIEAPFIALLTFLDINEW